MNERIKQLAEEAGFILWEDESWKPEGAFIDWSSNYDDVLDRYTELIVKECAGVGYDASYYECALNVSNKIRKHFGVEE
jgi:hypothetical protein